MDETQGKSEKISGKKSGIRELDETDRRILNILSENAREKLTVIARKIQLSPDSTKKRIDKLEKDGIIEGYMLRINTKKLNTPLGVHIYVKLKNVTEERYKDFLDAMMKNPRVIDFTGLLGEYDLYMVMLAKDTEEMDRMKIKIKQQFHDIIGEWKEMVVSKLYKLEVHRF